MELDNRTEKKILIPPAFRKTCRICLLSSDRTPSPSAYGSSLKKGAELSIIDQFKLSAQRTIQSIREIFGSEIVEGPEDKKLIVPCECKGTMKFIHRGCLNIWRLNSTRKDSYYKCEQCFATYKFNDTWLSRFLGNPLVSKVTAGLLFGLWFYSWFLFVKFSRNFPVSIDHGSYFVDMQDMNVMGYQRIFIVPEPTIGGDDFTPTSQTVVTSIFSGSQDQKDSQENSKPPFSDSWILGLVPVLFIRFMERHLVDLVYTVTIVGLFDALITNPSFILAVNMLYLIWRCVRHGGQFELVWLSACVGFAMARALMTIHNSASSLIQRYVKLRCIQIIDLEDVKATEIIMKHPRTKAETHLY